MSTTQNSQDYIRKHTTEYQRLQNAHQKKEPWKKWGPYLSERQWATVREDYGEKGEPWGYFNYEEARSRAYRWGEDGIFGICDDKQLLCFALTLWNGKDDHLKERFFGLPGFQGPNCGNHMEDVKEYYFYLDNTPTHSYMKALYKYPYEFPYAKLVDENKKLVNNEFSGKDKPEYELIDTGCFDDGHFDVMVEYSKKEPEDILIKITVWNQGNQSHRIHILPTLWFRNTWSWGQNVAEETDIFLEEAKNLVENNVAIRAYHKELGDFYLYCQNEIPLLFTDNNTDNNSPNNSESYFKNGINNYIIDQYLSSEVNLEKRSEVNPKKRGTKVSAHYTFNLASKTNKEIWLRLTKTAPDNIMPFGDDFEEVFSKRKEEADEFYKSITPFPNNPDDKKKQMQMIQRQAFAGILWNKQFYYYIVDDWLNGDSRDEKLETIKSPYVFSEERKTKRLEGRNKDWKHLINQAIISMPDKWEYPYYCVWDSAFHAITFALIDPDFAKEQLLLFTSPKYMNPETGQIPSCEFNFSEVHPPNLAWAALKIHEIEKEMYGSSSLHFLEEIFKRLEKNLKWWSENKLLGKDKKDKKYLFQAGFMGLDNISIVDRNLFLDNETVTIEQVDATSWVALFYLNILKIATMLNFQGEELKEHENKIDDYLRTFISIVGDINEIADKHQVSLWDNKDNFFYEILKISLKKFSPSPQEFSLELPLRYRSALGLIPLLAVELFRTTETTNSLTKRLKENFYDENSSFKKSFTQLEEKFQYLLGEEECVDIRPQDDRNQLLDMFLSIVNKQKLFNIITKLLDKDEFLSNYGIRSLSKIHEEHPYQLDGMINLTWKENDIQSFPIEMKYEPAETKVPVHIGNSNWRGPIWFPINFLLIETLKKFHEYFNICLNEENFKVLCPSVSHHKISLQEVVIEISERLIGIFLNTPSEKRRAVYGDNEKLYELFKNPETGKQDLFLFYEYFNGDTGQGLGASHQTGWTGLVANLIHQVVLYQRNKDKLTESST